MRSNNYPGYHADRKGLIEGPGVSKRFDLLPPRERVSDSVRLRVSTLCCDGMTTEERKAAHHARMQALAANYAKRTPKKKPWEG